MIAAARLGTSVSDIMFGPVPVPSLPQVTSTISFPTDQPNAVGSNLATRREANSILAWAQEHSFVVLLGAGALFALAAWTGARRK